MDEEKAQNLDVPNTDGKSTLGRKMALGSAVGMAATGVYLVSRLLLVPIILYYVSLAHYGLWSVCFIILSYAGMSAFGVQNAYIKYTAEYNVHNDVSSVNILMSTGLTIMGMICAVIFCAIAFGSQLIMDGFHVDPKLQELAEVMILGTAAAFLVELWLGAFKCLLEGLQEIALARMVWLASTLLEVGLVVGLLVMGYGIKGVMYAYVIKTLFEMALDTFFAFRRFKGLRIRPMLKREAFDALFVFGGKVQALGILGIFLGTFDRIVVTAMLGLNATGLFEVGRKLPFTARSVTGAAFAPFLPAASSLGHYWEESPRPKLPEKLDKYGRLCALTLVVSMAGAIPFLAVALNKTGMSISDPRTWILLICGVSILWPGIPLVKWLRDFMKGGERLVAEETKTIYLNGCRHINLINFILYAFILAAAPQLLLAWVGPGYGSAIPIIYLVGVMSFVHLATGVGSSIFKGVNRTGRELEYTLIQLILALIWIPGLAYLGGLLGAVAGTVISMVLPSFYFIQRTNVAFRIPFREYCSWTLFPGVAALIAGAIVFAGLRLMPELSRWWTVAEMLGFGGTYLILTAVILKRWFLSPREWEILLKPVMKIAGRFGSGKKSPPEKPVL